jgi:hypothetical protein
MRQTKIALEPEPAACIETKAGREYQKTLSQALSGNEGEEIKERLETLRHFLETTDFEKLRGEYEKYLVSGKRVKFILRLENGQPKYEITIT